MKNPRKLLKLLPILVIKRFFISKAPFFVLGLLVSYDFTENWVNSLMMDYLSYSLKTDRIAAIITTLQDGLSYISVIFFSLVSEASTGSFTMMAFCASATIVGLLLLWICVTTNLAFEYDMIYIAIILITLGKTTGKSMSEDFLYRQLDEKLKAKRECGIGKGKMKHLNNCTIALWWFCISCSAYTTVVTFSIIVNDVVKGIRFRALFMVGSYMLFYIGYGWYSHENLLSESNVGKICRICKAAYRKRNLRYLISEDRYYWKNFKQRDFYRTKDTQELRLFPRVPWLFGWLEKAAIVGEKNDDSFHFQEMKGELCTVKQVREIKGIALLICWGFTMFAYSFVAASGNSLFVVQASSLESFNGSSDISILLLLSSIMREIVAPSLLYFAPLVWFRKTEIHKRIMIIMMIGIGMVCAMVSSVFAWRVEVHRLYLIEKERLVLMSYRALVPQFLFLGMSTGLVEEGLKKLFHGCASKSVRNFAESFKHLVIGIGKLLTIPCIFIFSSWFKESINNSLLDRYFLMLAILNLVFLVLFALYYFMYVYKNEFSEDEEEITMEELILDHVLQSISEEAANTIEENLSMAMTPEGDGEANGSEEHLAVGEVSMVLEDDTEFEIKERLQNTHEIDSSSEADTREESLEIWEWSMVMFEGDSEDPENNQVVCHELTGT